MMIDVFALMITPAATLAAAAIRAVVANIMPCHTCDFVVYMLATRAIDERCC